MNPVPENIKRFLNQEHILSFSCRRNNGLHSVTVFYVYCEESVSLIFASGPGTLHSSYLQKNPVVAGTIFKNTREVSQIQGIQFTGRAYSVSDSLNAMKCRNLYRKSFPEAEKSEAEFWEIHVDYMKFTDNTVSFAEKTLWFREQK